MHPPVRWDEVVAQPDANGDLDVAAVEAGDGLADRRGEAHRTAGEKTAPGGWTPLSVAADDGRPESAANAAFSSTSRPASSCTSSRPHRSLGMLQLAGMIFFMTSGGGYGLEPMLGAAGPLLTLIGLCVAPWLWALPQALMASELSTLMPEDGGFVLWVDAALGPFWGFQLGWWSFADALVDNALFPRLFSDYLSRAWPTLPPPVSWLAGVVVLALCTTVNVLGVSLVGWAAVAFTLLVLAPFAIITVLGFAHTAPRAWLAGRPLAQVQWRLFLASTLWNWCGYDSCSTLAGEIRQVQHTFPRAMLLVLALTWATFTLPIAASVTVNNRWDEWRDAFWPRAADRIAGGRWLGVLFCLGGLSSAAGMLNSLIATSSRALFGMVRLRMLPQSLGALHARYDTPWVCVLLVACGTAAFTVLPFNLLVQMDSTLYCMKIALEFVSLALLRRRWPDRERPFRIGGGRWGLAYVAGCGLLCCTLMALLSGLWSAVAAVATALLGLALRAILVACGICGVSTSSAASGSKPAEGAEENAMAQLNGRYREDDGD